MSRKDDIKELITIHQRRLQAIKVQQARLGSQTPPHILIEIEDIEAKIEELQTQLEYLEGVQRPLKIIKSIANLGGLFNIGDRRRSKKEPLLQRRRSLERQLQNGRRRLNKLLEQQALYGSHTPVHLLNEIDDLITKLTSRYLHISNLS